MTHRRGLIACLGAMLAAPALARAGALMPVVSLTPVADRLERMLARGAGTLHGSGHRYVLERMAVYRGAEIDLTNLWLVRAARFDCDALLLIGPGAMVRA